MPSEYKEHHLREIMSAKDAATSKLGKAQGRCEELEREIVAMDRVLEDAVLAEESKMARGGAGARIGTGGSSMLFSPKRPPSMTGFPPSPFANQSVFSLPQPPPGAEASGNAPRRSGWKATSAPSPSPGSAGRNTPRCVSTPSRGPPSSPRNVLSRLPGEERGELDQNALDRQLNLLSTFLVNDKSALRIQKLREKSLTPKT